MNTERRSLVLILMISFLVKNFLKQKGPNRENLEQAMEKG